MNDTASKHPSLLESRRILRRRMAFSLIELLVVIAVLAVLIGLIFSVVGRVGDTGKRAKCMSNLRQIGTMMLRYVGENNGEFPVWREPSQPLTNQMWQQKISGSEIDEPMWFVCPSHTAWTRFSTADNYYRWFAFTAGSSYGMNHNYLAGKRIFAIPEPARIIMIGERQNTIIPPNIATASGGLWWSQQHGTGANFAFIDGHVEFIEATLQGSRIISRANGNGAAPTSIEANFMWNPDLERP